MDGLKEILAVQEVVLAEKNAAADALITVVGAESEKVAKEKAIGMKNLRNLKNIYLYLIRIDQRIQKRIDGNEKAN